MQRKKRLVFKKITSFYPNDKSELKAIGYSEIQGEKVVSYAEGKIEGKRLQLFYRHSQAALPPGWESEGIMNLIARHMSRF